jgi:hypothetical protein
MSGEHPLPGEVANDSSDTSMLERHQKKGIHPAANSIIHPPIHTNDAIMIQQSFWNTSPILTMSSSDACIIWYGIMTPARDRAGILSTLPDGTTDTALQVTPQQTILSDLME